MIKFFILNSDIFNDALFSFYLDRADEERRQKTVSLADRQKRNDCLAAGVILPAALAYCGIKTEITLSRNRFGKPELTAPKNIFFNLSHSCGKVVCAISDKEVGCDIQKITGADYKKIMKRFTEAEQAQIAGAGKDAKKTFFRMWTVKESYLKALGVGFARPLNSFEVQITDEGVKISDPEENGNWHVCENFSVDGYCAACCAKSGFDGLEPICLDGEAVKLYNRSL